MSEDDRLGYSGPEDKWLPELGQHIGPAKEDFFVEDGTYADMDLLSKNLDILVHHLSATISLAEERLRKRNLEIKGDTALSSAQGAEWPSELGAKKEYVSYMQYRAMDKKNSRGSNYIRKKYQEAARGSKGGTSADVAYVAGLVKGEVVKIQAFITNYILEGCKEPNKQRVIELFQDWTYYALEDAGHLRGIIASEGKEQEKYPNAEMERLTGAEHRRY